VSHTIRGICCIYCTTFDFLSKALHTSVFIIYNAHFKITQSDIVKKYEKEKKESSTSVTQHNKTWFYNQRMGWAFCKDEGN
jgi:hypothetical protein